MPEIEKTERTIAPIGQREAVTEDPDLRERYAGDRRAGHGRRGVRAAARHVRRQLQELRRGRGRARRRAARVGIRGHRRRRLQVGGHHPPRRVPRRDRPDRRQEGRRGRRAPGEDGGQGRLRRPLQGKSREDEGLGRRGARLPGAPRGRGPGHRAREGRPRRGHRRAGVPARQPGGHAPGAQPRQPARPGAAHARDQGQQEARQHRALAQGGSRGGERRAQARHAGDPRRGQGPDGHREEHHGVRRLRRPGRHRRPAPHHGHVVGPHQPPERSAERGRRDQGPGPEVRPRLRARLARLQAAQGRSLDDRDPQVPDRQRASRARSSASPTTARSSSWRRASRA